MPCTPFERLPLAALLLAALVAATIILGSDTVLAAEKPAKPEEKKDFKGTWDGVYIDNQKRSGKGEYHFRDEKDGEFEVSVSWKDKALKPYKMTLKGKRLGPDAVQLEGDHDGTKYRYLGRVEKGKLELYYLSIDEKTGQSGSGHSTLTPRNK